MANVILMAPVFHQEEQEKYTNVSGDIYVFRLRSADSALTVEFIWATAPAPNSNAYWDDMTNGSLLFDLADSGLIFYKNNSTSFAEVGDLT